MKRKKIIYAIASGIIFISASAGAAFHFAPKPPEDDGFLKIYFLDIGQGDSIYVRSPGGRDMLVDGGPTGAVTSRLAEIMPADDKAIDFVVETHPDADHISGLIDVLEGYKVGLFIEPGIESKSTLDDRLEKLREDKGIEQRLARRGMSFDLGGGVSFNILFPDGDVSKLKDTNDASIVGQVIYGSTTIMLTGDAPKKTEDHLLALDKVGLKSDVLKAGHHGSRTSSGKAFVETVDPDYAVISSGKGNRYGHPNQETLDTFNELHIPILRTDTLGTIEFESDGVKIWRAGATDKH